MCEWFDLGVRSIYVRGSALLVVLIILIKVNAVVMFSRSADRKLLIYKRRKSWGFHAKLSCPLWLAFAENFRTFCFFFRLSSYSRSLRIQNHLDEMISGFYFFFLILFFILSKERKICLNIYIVILSGFLRCRFRYQTFAFKYPGRLFWTFLVVFHAYR